MATMIMEQTISLALETFKEMIVTIWKEDHIYLILFLFCVLIYSFCNKKLKKRHY